MFGPALGALITQQSLFVIFSAALLAALGVAQWRGRLVERQIGLEGGARPPI